LNQHLARHHTTAKEQTEAAVLQDAQRFCEGTPNKLSRSRSLGVDTAASKKQDHNRDPYRTFEDSCSWEMVHGPFSPLKPMAERSIDRSFLVKPHRLLSLS
jgi:hypothetical protein